MYRICLALLLAPLAVCGAGKAHFATPEFLGAPDAYRAVNNRALTMAPSMAVAPNGRLWATWYAGVTPAEDTNNYVVLATSGDNGKTWEEVLVADPDKTGPIRAFDPEIWMAPDGNLYWIWAQGQRMRNEGIDGISATRFLTDTWALKLENPESNKPHYDKPVFWAEGVMMCKPIVLSSGEWVLPVSMWKNVEDSAQMVVSTDQGKTWSVQGAVDVPSGIRSFDEHMIVERKDGSLWMLVRIRGGIGESVSTDGGKTWSKLTRSEIPHSSARFFIYRLQSGNLLLVRHAADPETGRIRRTHITAYVSKDDGKTWSDGLLLDERGVISYPDGQQGPDGTIYITYDRNRSADREILFAAFTEDDVLAANPRSETVRLRQLISKGTGGRERSRQTAAGAKARGRDNADGAAFMINQPGAVSAEGYEVVPLKAGARWFMDRKYVAHPSPTELEGISFLQVPMNGNKSLTCTREGMVYFLTPAADRNKDSQATALEQQGFERVAVREYVVFGDGRLANACTLYQKHCKVGETIHFGKWAVPLMYP